MSRSHDRNLADTGDHIMAKNPKGKAQTEPTKTRVKNARKADPGSTKRMSALEAAARVLQDAKEPMSCPALIERMASKGYWKSPGGKTPHATLSAAILREIRLKSNQSRFRKVAPGRFQST